MHETPHVPQPPEGGADAVIYLMRLANAVPKDSERDLRLGLTKLAIELNQGLPTAEQILLVRDERCQQPLENASTAELVDASYIAVGTYTETPEQAETRGSRMGGYLMLERYFVWCRAMAEESVRRSGEPAPAKQAAAERPLNVTEYKVGAFLGHWIAALCPVIEGWEELRLSDPEIDALLAEGDTKGYRGRLFRFRHGIFHFQRKLDDPRFSDFMDPTGEARLWMIQLEREFERFFSHHASTDYAALDDWLDR